MICSGCKADKPRRHSHHYEDRDDDEVIIWVDLAGYRWHSKKCPECYLQANPHLMREENHLKLRTCRNCEKFLTANRYFHCTECKPVLAEDPIVPWERPHKVYRGPNSVDSLNDI